MKYGIYGIKDTLSGMMPQGIMLFPNDAPAARMFGDLAADNQTMVGRHVEDHELHRIGTFDMETATIADTTSVVVLTGAQWKMAQATASQAEASLNGRTPVHG